MSPLAPQVPASLHMTLLDLEIQVFYYYTCLEKDLIIILLQDAKIVIDRNLAVLNSTANGSASPPGGAYFETSQFFLLPN